MAAWKSETKKFTRYCSSFSTPSLKNSQLTLSEFTSAPHRRVAPDRVLPRDPEDREPDEDPEELGEEPADELLVREVADEALDREVEGPLEGQEARDLLNPVRHERKRHETAREQELGHHVEVEDRRAARRPEAEHPEALLQHGAEQVRAPDRDREGRDLCGGRVERGVEHERQ